MLIFFCERFQLLKEGVICLKYETRTCDLRSEISIPITPVAHIEKKYTNNFLEIKFCSKVWVSYIQEVEKKDGKSKKSDDVKVTQISLKTCASETVSRDYLKNKLTFSAQMTTRLYRRCGLPFPDTCHVHYLWQFIPKNLLIRNERRLVLNSCFNCSKYTQMLKVT